MGMCRKWLLPCMQPLRLLHLLAVRLLWLYRLFGKRRQRGEVHRRARDCRLKPTLGWLRSARRA